MVELRTIVQELIDYQLNDYPEEAIAQKQRELNVAYDRFADQYGLINSRANAPRIQFQQHGTVAGYHQGSC